MNSEYRAIFHAATQEAQPFWQACEQGIFSLQNCNDCSKFIYPPRLYCTHCGGEHLQWLAAPLTGTVYSFTHVFVSFHGDFWNSQLPYTSVLIDLDCGVRFVSRLIGDGHMDVKAGDRVEINMTRVQGKNLPFTRLIAK
jgi:hypothetical protein